MNNINKLILLPIISLFLLTGCNEMELKQIDQSIAANNNATDITIATINGSTDLSIAQLNATTDLQKQQLDIQLAQKELQNQLALKQLETNRDVQIADSNNVTQMYISDNQTEVELAYVQLYNFLSQSFAITSIILVVLGCITILLIRLINKHP